MSTLIIIAKAFATFMALVGALGCALSIYIAFKAPTHGTAVESIAGIIVAGLCLYGAYLIWY
jgi:hypothetical protein